MEFYHGTTLKSARLIVQNGFRPRGGAVWFTTQLGYARNRAEQKARRRHGRPLIFKCNLRLADLQAHTGLGKIRRRGSVIAIHNSLDVQPLQSTFEFVASPELLARWINSQLGLFPYNGVSPSNWGVERLSHWMNNRIGCGTGNRIDPDEFLQKGRQWLPTFFNKLGFGAETVPLYPLKHNTLRVKVVLPAKANPVHEKTEHAEIIKILASANPKRRIRGLKLLEKTGIEELFEWCILQLNDESVEVVCTALRIMSRCDDGYIAPILPYAAHENRRIRAGAIAALAKHTAEDTDYWFERGLKDSAPCVRMEVARLLPGLDRTAHRTVFDIARHDPHPVIKRIAKKRA